LVLGGFSLRRDFVVKLIMMGNFMREIIGLCGF